MTEKLYECDGHLSAFEAVVLQIAVTDGRTVVVLDRTAFFPTGGGQACDTGRINGVRVTAAEEIDGIVYHYTECEPPFSVGDTVTGTIDYEQRFARMQAHSGEHIVSGVAHNLFGAENVGFHMDGLLMTVDFDLPLTDADMALVEEKANEAIWADVPVHAERYSGAALASIEYRSKKEFEGDVRIVTVEGVDRCACCAPHVARTGEIGLVKILSRISHRGGVRITLIAGKEAYRDYCGKYRQTLRIAGLLAAKHNETDLAVEALIAQNKELKNAVYAQKKRYCAAIVARQNETEGNAVVFADGCDTEELCEISLGMLEKCGGASVACAGSDAEGYAYVITCRGVVMNQYAKHINGALNGRGGGRDEMIRGSFRASKDEISRFFETFEVERP